jgi:iron complex outermembrane recepter protein
MTIKESRSTVRMSSVLVWATRVMCASTVLAFAGVTGALAQQPAAANPTAGAQASSEQLQTVIVTATKRSQNVQDIPIAVQTFTSSEIASRGLTSVNDLSVLSPGVNFEAGAPFSGDSSVLSASIRGIGQSDFAFNINPAVGVYVDGVYYARTIGANVNLLDVSNLTILKGAQGTLFGANSIGGAINITTHTPGETPRFIGTLTGGSFNRRDMGFTADIPIIHDKLLSSITVQSFQRDGYQNAIPYPTNGPVGNDPIAVDPQTAFPKSGYTTGDSYGGQGIVAMRGKLLWFASDKLTVTFEGDWTHEDQTALPEVVLGTYAGNLGASTFSTLYDYCISNDASTLAGLAFPLGSTCNQPRAQVPGISIGAPALAGAGYVGVPAGVIPFPGVNPTYNYNNIAAYGDIPCNPANPQSYCGSSQPRLFYGYHTANGTDPVAQTGNYDTTYAVGRPDFAKQNVFGFSLTGQYDISNNLQLKSITGYRQDLWQIGTQLDGTPETFQEVTDQQHQWQVSQEVQLLGKSLQNKLNWVAGLFYFNESGYVHDFVPFEGLLYVYDNPLNDVTNTYYAGYLHLDYQLNEHWEFVAGERYTHSETFFIGGQGDLNSFPFGSQCWQSACPYSLVPGVPDNQIVPSAAPTGNPFYLYFPGTPDSQGWHTSTPTASIQYHFNDDVMLYASWSRGFQLGGWTTRLSAAIPTPQDARFGPEYAKQWELGLKSEWFNHRLQVNAAAFYTNFDGIQLNVQQGISPVLQNAGNAKILGGEIQFQSLLPGGLQLNGSASYIDAYYTSVNPSANIPEFALPDGETVCPAVVHPAGGSDSPGCSIYDGPSLPGLPHAAGYPVVYQTDARLPYTPKWKLTFDPEYDLLLPNESILRFIPVFTYTSAMYDDSLNTPLLRQPAARELDASVHYVSPSGDYDLAVGGTNLTNDRYFTTGAVNYGAGEAQGYINAPPEWYATLRVKFGG